MEVLRLLEFRPALSKPRPAATWGLVKGFVRPNKLGMIVFVLYNDNLTSQYFDNLKFNIFDAVAFSACLLCTTHW